MFLKFNYFFYFFFLGVFFNLIPGHFETLGFSGGQRAIIFGSIPVFGFIFNIIWGRIADIYQIRLKLVAFLSLLASCGLLFVFLKDDYFAYLLMALIMGSIVYPLIPLNDSLVINYSKKKLESYGNFRWWGTFSFIFANMLLLVLYSVFKVKNEKVLMMIMPMSLALIFFSSLNKKETIILSEGNNIKISEVLFRKSFLIFLITIFFHNIAFVAMFSYLSAHLKNLEFSQGYISFCWGISPIFEVFIFKYSKNIHKKISSINILRIAIFAGILRWMFMAYFENGTIIAGSQILHSFAFGGYYVASIAVLTELIPNELRSTGQGIFAGSISLALFIGNVFMGFIFDAYGTFAIFKWAVVFAVISFILSMFLKSKD